MQHVFALWLMKRKRKRAKRLSLIISQAQARKKLVARVVSLCFSVVLYSLYFLIQSFPQRPKIVRSVWAVERSSHWWSRVVLQTYTDRQWVEDFRMTKETFFWLSRQLKPFVQKKRSRFREPISAVHRTAIAVYQLATGSNFKTVANLFGVSRAIVCLAVHAVTNAIVEHLMPTFIKFPTGQRLEEVVNGFRVKYGFPQCLGAIDGTHIPVTPPASYKDDFRNRKGWHSVNAQCVVDHELMFLDVFVGWPGRSHDARVFRNSPLYLRHEEGCPMFPQRPRIVEGREIPLVLLGDPAYPLQDWLMKPYRAGANMTAEQRRFNYCLSRSRMVVERAFGRLKGRWRVLMKTMETNISRAPSIFLACCVLHNICEVWREDFIDMWLEEVRQEEERTRRQQPPRPVFTDRQVVIGASDVRDTLRQHFSREN